MTSPDPRPADKREAILEAALELFATRGFDGTSVPSIAEAARVGTGTVYRYFEGKEAMVNALFRAWKARLGEAVLADFPTEAPAREQLHAYWTRMARFAQAHPRAFRFLELHHHQPYLDAESRAVEARLLGLFREVVASQREAGALKDMDPEVLIAVVYGAFVGLVKAASLGLLELSDAVLAAAETCVWEAVRR